MTTSKNIYNLIILDESGSMEVVKDATINGFRDLASHMISISQEIPSQNHFISLITFNGDGIRNRLTMQPIIELAAISNRDYKPYSTTPLYDAICKSVLTLKHELYGMNDYGVLVTIITDGQENTSKEFSLKETKLLIENMSQDSRWGFGLIGANIDLKETASSLSIPLIRTIEFAHTDVSVGDMFRRYGKAQKTLSDVFANGGNFNDDIPF